MKAFLNLIFATAFSLTAYAQTQVIMVKSPENKKWGYSNLKGEMIIPAQFEKCYSFTEDGFTIIEDDGAGWYFLNIKGEKIKPEVNKFTPRTLFLGTGMLNFSDGLIPGREKGGFGYFNTSGKLVIPMNYEGVTDFENGFATVKSGKRFLILDKTGKEIIPSIHGLTDLRAFSEGLAPFEAADRFGFIDAEGKKVIEAKYKSVGYFKDGVAWFKNEQGKVGYINKKGEVVIKAEYVAGDNFDNESGLARVKKGEQWLYINRTGVPMRIDYIKQFNDFSDGLLRAEKNEKHGFLNNKGEWVIAPELDGARDFRNGYAAAKKGEKWGLIDKTGKWVMEPKFDGIRDVEVIK